MFFLAEEKFSDDKNIELKSDEILKETAFNLVKSVINKAIKSAKQINNQMDDKQLIENQLSKSSYTDREVNELTETSAKIFYLSDSIDAKNDELKNSELFIIKKTELPLNSSKSSKQTEFSTQKNDQHSSSTDNLNYNLTESFKIEMDKGYFESIKFNNYNQSVVCEIQNGKLIFFDIIIN